MSDEDDAEREPQQESRVGRGDSVEREAGGT